MASRPGRRRRGSFAMRRLWTMLVAAAPAAQAILVAPGSPCSSGCGNVLDSTSTADLVCSTGAYAGATGQLFQGCVECEMRSRFSNRNQSDVESMLYNLRYAVSYCLFGDPSNKQLVNTPCVTSKACGPFRDAIGYKNLSAQYQGFEYCQIWPVGDDVDYKSCAECLQAAENFYLANFVTVLQAGCDQKPAPGVGLGLEGNLFSTDSVNITAPTPTASVNPAWFDQGPLDLGAKVGIAVGGLVLVLVVLGCAIVLNGKRRRRAFLRRLEAKYGHKSWPSPGARGEKAEPSRQPSRGWDDTPVSQQPLRGWDDSPMTASTDRPYPKYFSPYSSQYNSPVSAHHSPSTQLLGIMEPLGGDEPAPSSPGGKGKLRQEAYEMHQVDGAAASGSAADIPRAEAPVLSHPGYGRTSNSPARQYVPNEADVRPGTAL
ncbi:hypothetical protein CDD83_8331 [Cordyceps sp. RAO-2017]|nr:hypothetical protein CDD83_8331 [Cordyceps sp. RAO-2017]